MNELTILVSKGRKTVNLHRVGRRTVEKALQVGQSIVDAAYPAASVDKRELGGDHIWYVELTNDDDPR